MHRLIAAGLTAVALAFVGGLVGAEGDIPDGAFVRSPSGHVYYTKGTTLIPVAVYPIADEQFGAFTIAPTWLIMMGGEVTTGSRPDWAALAIGATSPPAAVPPVTWQTVAKWTGQGSKNTEPFSVNGPWRVLVTATQGSVSNQICFSAKRVTDERLGVNECMHGGGETYSRVGSGAGTYQMEITGTSGSTWSIEVQHQQ